MQQLRGFKRGRWHTRRACKLPLALADVPGSGRGQGIPLAFPSCFCAVCTDTVCFNPSAIWSALPHRRPCNSFPSPRRKSRRRTWSARVTDDVARVEDQAWDSLVVPPVRTVMTKIARDVVC